MSAVVSTTVSVVKPVAKVSPARQMREMLARSRRVGLPFERAWDTSWARVRWPHDTEHRRTEKRVLLETRVYWQAAYERTGRPNRNLAALLRLLSETAEALRDAESRAA